MLVPLGFLATLCVRPGAVSRLRAPRPRRGDGVAARTAAASSDDVGGLGMSSTVTSFDHVVPAMFGLALLGGLIVSTALTARRGLAVRQASTWGCGGELTPRSEHGNGILETAADDLGAVYRPTRQVDAVAEVSPYFVHEVRYRAEIEPTFERYLYGPLLRGVVRMASGMKVLQAGSLHVHLAYVLMLAVILLMWLGGTT